MLSRDRAREWLAAASPELLVPDPGGALAATPVSPRVNSVKNDDPECLSPPTEDGSKRQKGRGQLDLF